MISASSELGSPRRTGTHYVRGGRRIDDHQADLASWGFIINSFNELESEILDQLKKKFLRHDLVWAVGPLLPLKYEDRPKNSKATHRDIAWLDSCPVDGSVVYIGFSTQITLTDRQMERLAAALEASRVKFIWSNLEHQATNEGCTSGRRPKCGPHRV